ncbi:hypothetical protein KIPB_001363 [Kipferlia bialata]|uniref:VOC domain-containing protein n=1 Tax=Kipferlia bialata TaxID=797122 RepID=A0A9K3GF53_9EUKA|nr:hypothetical protein KIPB_001363 [Kipferlia bialata]|eukprot:g1363.t1
MTPTLHHVCFRIPENKIEEELQFYYDLGMELKSHEKFAQWKFDLYFLGFPGKGCTVELTTNYGTNEYSTGEAFSHIAIGADDVYAYVAGLPASVKVTRPAGPMGGKEGATVIAFVASPSGTRVEVVPNAM